MKHIKIIPILIFSIFYPCLSNASDRWEDVKAQADLHMSRVLGAPPREVFTPHITSGACAEEQLREFMKKEGVIIPFLDNKDFIKQQEEFNINLFNTLNAGISLLSDYLYLAMTDKDLSWTRENSYIFNNKSKQRIDTDYFTYKVVSINEAADTATVSLELYSRIYEIERQKLCLIFTTHLELLKYWKSKIFPNSSPRSYAQKNAAALKGQLFTTIEGLNSPQRPQIEGLNRVASDSLIEIHQKIMDSLPEAATHMATLKPGDGKSKLLSIQKNMQKTEQRIQNQAGELAKEYARLMTYFQNMGAQLKRIQFIDNKIESTKSLLTAEYKKFQQIRASMGSRARKISHPLKLDQIFCPRQCITNKIQIIEKLLGLTHGEPDEPIIPVAPEHNSDNQGKKEAEHLPQCQADKQDIEDAIFLDPIFPVESLLNTSNEGEKEAELSPQHLALEQDIQDEIIFDDDYWRAEHQRHQLRKKELLQEKQSPTLSQYEVNLYTYLKDNIFTNVTALKVHTLKHDLKAHKFEVKVNTKGNGSVYNVSPTRDNPLFARDLEYSSAYFNVHLPSDNIPIPYDYFRYLRSGFSNVFGLTLDYINSQLNIEDI